LYVDDDADNREMLGWVLRNAGYQVREAATGGEALRLAEERPDLVVLDVNLPDINGFEVCRRIKAHPATTSIPVLHLSAMFVRSEDKTYGLEEGADGYLTKPVEPEELIAHVKALLRIHQAEEAARQTARQGQTTFGAMSEPVGLLDPQGRVVRCNGALSELLQRPPSSILGRPYHPLVRQALGPGEVPDLARVQQSGAREVLELASGER